jgi:toxin ParE1/3/4
MSRIEFAPEAGADFERILQHLADFDAADPNERIQGIIDAIDALERNPLIGRPAASGLRELVIGRGMRGYLALYRYEPSPDLVLVLAVRSQKEAGYADPQL